ncbi:SGNH/GDSL hydrolase family protein [Maridesulfovibrio sp.]|uniref:SGNH/GDSL hydrolase family protein n=1 Tax=Maridesulfovibrio sp. TaxID=2795000 RepID=UPI002A18A76E|nr:SGNH/GDSL hydrolase family protein [Maridesulfovibrio sp.]
MKRILTFGDSFSDNGFSNGCGYNRLSNGRVWVEYLGELLGASLEDRAWCGATSGMGNASGPKDWSGLSWQVDTYQADAQSGDVLCTLLIGINDVYEGKGDAQEVVSNTLSALEVLVGKGVQNFLLGSVPDISDAPAYIQEYAEVKGKVRDTILDINSRLKSAVFGRDGFAELHPAVTVNYFDAYKTFKSFVTDGLFKVTDKPWNGTYTEPQDSGFLWWDDWHPMTEAHRKLAFAAVEVLKRGKQSSYHSNIFSEI